MLFFPRRIVLLAIDTNVQGNVLNFAKLSKNYSSWWDFRSCSFRIASIFLANDCTVLGNSKS